MSQQDPTPKAAYAFTAPAALDEWTLSKKAWLEAKDKHYNGLATSALVFDGTGRVLLLRRAAHDSMPNVWEPPGGGVDDDDPSILHGCARELREEAGLEARRIVRVIPGHELGDPFTNNSGSKILLRFSFEVEVDGGAADVVTDPEEHSQAVWATEDEVVASRMQDGMDLPIAGKVVRAALLDAFRTRNGRGEGAN